MNNSDKHAARTTTFEEIKAFQPERNIAIEDTPAIDRPSGLSLEAAEQLRIAENIVSQACTHFFLKDCQ